MSSGEADETTTINKQGKKPMQFLVFHKYMILNHHLTRVCHQDLLQRAFSAPQDLIALDELGEMQKLIESTSPPQNPCCCCPNQDLSPIKETQRAVLDAAILKSLARFYLFKIHLNQIKNAIFAVTVVGVFGNH